MRTSAPLCCVAEGIFEVIHQDADICQIQLVDSEYLRLQGEVDLVLRQLSIDLVVLSNRVIQRAIDQVNQHLGALDVA